MKGKQPRRDQLSDGNRYPIAKSFAPMFKYNYSLLDVKSFLGLFFFFLFVRLNDLS